MRTVGVVGLIAGLLLCAACVSAPRPEYGRPLPPGAPALLKLGPSDVRPDFADQWTEREDILPALERSIAWCDKPSARTHFPIEGITLDRVRESLVRFREILLDAAGPDEFDARVAREFDIYKSAGWDGRGGGVLYTGYCTPILDGSLEPDAEYRYPLYGLPDDLVKDPMGRILGQRTATGTRPYPDRRTIENRGLLEGQGLELVWMRNPIDAYIAHVNGSAVIRLQDRKLLRLGYAGNNGLDYVSLRQILEDSGRLDPDQAGLAAIRRWAEQNPGEVERTLQENPRYVFFTPIDGNPRGSLNVEVTANRTLATDKALFPRASLVYVDAKLPGRSRSQFNQFMFDQDTGGAIRTAGRADIYLGTGASAERQAGSTRVPGQLYYLFLKR